MTNVNVFAHSIQISTQQIRFGIVSNGKIGLFLNSSFQNFYAYIPWIAYVPRYKYTKFRVVCVQITMIFTMSLLSMKQGFHKAMCSRIAMGVLTGKLIMSSNDKI